MTTPQILTSSSYSPKITGEFAVPYSSTGDRRARETWSQPPASCYLIHVEGSVLFSRELKHYASTVADPVDSDEDKELDDELAMWQMAGQWVWMTVDDELETQ